MPDPLPVPSPTTGGGSWLKEVCNAQIGSMLALTFVVFAAVAVMNVAQLAIPEVAAYSEVNMLAMVHSDHGAVLGDTDGVAPGCKLSLGWKRLDYYLESEVVFDAHHDEDNFIYAWSELGWKPVDWLRVGLVGQRTRVVEDGLDVQRGLLAQAMAGRWTFGVDWFNPLGDASFTVLVATVEF